MYQATLHGHAIHNQQKGAGSLGKKTYTGKATRNFTLPPKLDLVCVICNFGATLASIHSQECMWEGGRLIHIVIHTYIKEFHTHSVEARVQEREKTYWQSNKEFHFAP